MFAWDFLAALIFAILFGMILFTLLGWGTREGGVTLSSVFLVFLLIFFLIWAGGIWMTPFGPTVWEVHWAPFLVVGIFVLLLMAAVGPPYYSDRYPRRPLIREDHLTPSESARLRGEVESSEVERTEMEEESVHAAAVAFGMFFWILLAFLIIAVGIGYIG